MKAEEIRLKLRQAVTEQIELRPEGLDKLYVATPFQYDDGDHLEIYLQPRDGVFRFTDDGLTLMKLSYDVPEFSSAARNKVIERILMSQGIANNGGELTLDAGEDEIGPALLSFIEAIIRISDVAFLKKETVRSVFLEEFRTFMTQHILDRRLLFEHSFADHDPNDTYPIDCVVQNGGQPLFAFAVTSDSKCNEATITIGHYERKGFAFKSMAVFEDQEDIGRKVLARLTDVCDRQFSNLSGNKDRIIDHVETVTA